MTFKHHWTGKLMKYYDGSNEHVVKLIECESAFHPYWRCLIYNQNKELRYININHLEELTQADKIKLL